MAAVNEAWFVLRDPTRRAAYDAKVALSDPAPGEERADRADAATDTSPATTIRLRRLIIASMVLLVVVSSVFMLIALVQSG